MSIKRAKAKQVVLNLFSITEAFWGYIAGNVHGLLPPERRDKLYAPIAIWIEFSECSQVERCNLF